jgi:hypothetical protein
MSLVVLYVIDEGYRHILISFCEFVGIYLGSLGYARSAQQNKGGFVANARSVHLRFTESKRTCKEFTPERFTDSRRSLNIVEHLGG